MKNLFKIIFFTFLTIGLLVSITAQKSYGSGLLYKPERGLISDSSINNDPVMVDSFNLIILPPSSGVQFYKDGIVFLFSSKNEKKMVPEHLSFGAIEAYYAILEDTILGKNKVFSPSFSFSYPCEALTFSSDFLTMYFTKYSKNNGREKIYKAEYSESNKKPGWLCDISPLNFCTDNSTYTHPALSTNGNIMIFASDKNGTAGGMDLFMTHKEENKWSAPENLGTGINTEGNELFPYLDSLNNLFFSSDELPGYGGYDIFISKFNGDNWDRPINLSKRINSGNNDVAFTISRKDGQSAFFTTKQDFNKSEKQLYKITFNGEKKNSDLLYLSDVLYFLALLENEFPFGEILTSADTSQKIPAEPEVTAEVIVEDTISIPQEEFFFTFESKDNKDIVVYKIQFQSTIKSKGNFQISVNDKSYNAFEYFYKGEFRYTIGEFSTLAPAVELQDACRLSGYPKAFVAAFKNNVRSLDPELFKK